MSKETQTTTSIVDQVAKEDAKAGYENKVPKKIKKLVKAYNKSKYYSPFTFAMNLILEGEQVKWAEIPEEQQQAIIEISRAIENYG